MEGAVIAFATTYNGGVPTTKTQVTILSFAVGKALWNAGRRWTNVGTNNLVIVTKEVGS